MKKWSSLLVLLVLISCRLPEEPDIYSDLEADVSLCFNQPVDGELDIMTWNLREFPFTSNAVAYLDDVLEGSGADVVLLQEIVSPFALQTALERTAEWEGYLMSSGDL